MLSVIVCAGGAQTFHSLMMPTCVHFRKMEHFSSLEGKVRELETPTATLTYRYDIVPETSIDSKKHHVSGWEQEDAFFHRAFLGEKSMVTVMVARLLDDNSIDCCFRSKNFEKSTKVRVGRRKYFSSQRNQLVLARMQAWIDHVFSLILNLYIFTHGRILYFAKLGHSKQDCEYRRVQRWLSESNCLFWLSNSTIN